MEGTSHNNRRERRAPRILDFDLNKEPEPEPEPGFDLNPALPRIKVIHNFVESSEADVVFDISNVAQNKLDMVVNSGRFAREGKELHVQSAKIHEDGEVTVSLRLAKISEVDGNSSSAADKSGTGASGGAGRKRARSDDSDDAASSSTESEFWPTQDKVEVAARGGRRTDTTFMEGKTTESMNS